MVDEDIEILSNDEVAEDFFLAKVYAPQICQSVYPGQFVNLKVGHNYTPFLRLPLSVGGINKKNGSIDLMYECIGPKTELLSQKHVGDRLQCLGPLGQGFSMPPGLSNAVLVGGGIGLPPMIFWGNVLLAEGVDVTLLVGAKTAVKHFDDVFLIDSASRVSRSTDDGSLGHHGLVTDLLKRELDTGISHVYTCGPHGMMRAVAEMCMAKKVSCHVSLEEYMACGIGICMGCVMRVRNGGKTSYADYKRICVEGPVFDACTVCWKEA